MSSIYSTKSISVFKFMNAKELLEQYVAEALSKLNKGNSPKVRNILPSIHINHVHKQAATLARLIGRDNGIY